MKSLHFPTIDFSLHLEVVDINVGVLFVSHVRVPADGALDFCPVCAAKSLREVEQDLVAGEEEVDFLEGQARSFRIEKVDDGNETRVEYSKVNIGLVSDRDDADRRDFDDEEGEDPVGRRRECGRRGANGQWRVF